MSGRLVRAARHGDAERVKHLLEKGAAADERGGQGRTALHWAAYKCYPDIVRLLLVSRSAHRPGPALRFVQSRCTLGF